MSDQPHPRPRVTPDLLCLAPEMAAVRILADAITVLRFTIIAEHHSLREHDGLRRRDGTPTLRCARALIRRAFALEAALNSYAAALENAIRPQPPPQPPRDEHIF